MSLHKFSRMFDPIEPEKRLLEDPTENHTFERSESSEEERGQEGELIKKKPRSLNAIELVILVYFWTCGGPFGIEAAVEAGGAYITYIAIFIICIFWSLPQALLAAELSLMMKVNGGNVVWVARAFGDFFGFVNAGCYIISYLVNQSILAVSFVLYIPGDFSIGIQWAMRIGFMAFCTIVNIVGIKWLSRLSWIFLVIIFSPFVAQMVTTIVLKVPINFNAIIDISPPLSEVNWGLLISTTVWALGGYDSVGTVAGEVEGKKTFLIGIIGSFPLNLLNYCLPIMLDYIMQPDWNKWEAGYFSNFVSMAFPLWLSIWMTFAATVSNFGQISSGISSIARAIWAMGKGKEEGISHHRFLPYFVSYSWIRNSGTVRPVVAIVITSIAMLLLSALPFNFLAQLFLVVRVVNLFFEYGALIYLKYKEPDTLRPFKIPGGVIGAILISLPTFAISIFALIYSDTMALIAGFSAVGVIVLCYPFKLFWLYQIKPRLYAVKNPEYVVQ